MEKQKTDPRVLALVVLVIILIIGAVGTRLWANQQRLDVPNFRAMTSAADGRVLIVLGDDLHVESGAGESLRVMPLSKWSVQDFHGALAVLSDGSVILGRGRLGEVGLAEGRRMMLRERPSGDDPVEGFQRCSLRTDECSVLEGQGNPIEVRRGFSLAVDERNGFLYASDPANHRVLQATLDGELLDASESGWRFPNGVRVLGEDRVAFADTNRHRYVELAVGKDGFGEILREESITGWPGVTALQRFPFEVHVDEAGTLWMLVADEGMTDAFLYRREPGGRARRLELPEAADPVAIAQSGERILVADAASFAIHAFDMKGNGQGMFGSPELRGRLNAHRARHDHFARIFDYSLVGVLAFAIPALGIGVLLQYRIQNAEHSEDLDAGQPLPGSPVDHGMEEAGLLLSNPEAQLAKVRGEFVFWRKFSVLGTREEFRLKLLAWSLIIVVLASFWLIATSAAPNDDDTLKGEFNDPRLYLAIISALVAFTFYWLSGMYERLIVDRRGVRYVSFLSGPLRFMNGLYPDWFAPWEKIETIRLKQLADGRRPHNWIYEIRVPGEGRRKLRPLNWRLAGEHEVGVPLKSLSNARADIFRETIRKTLLYRLLSARSTRAD